MNDDSEKLSRVFGDWYKSPHAYIGAIATILVAGTAAIQCVENLSNPILRWIVAGSVFLLCSLAIVFEKKRRSHPLVTEVSTAPVVVEVSQRRGYLIGAIASLTFLIVDLTLSMSLSTPIIDVGPTNFERTGIGVTVEASVAEELSSLPLRHINSTNPPILVGDLSEARSKTNDRCIFFDVKKRHNVAEVLIEDIEIVIEDIQPAPVIYGEGAGLDLIDNTFLFYELENRNDPLPWVISPRQYLANGSLKKWERGIFALRDDFTSRISLVINSQVPGVIKLSVRLKARSGFGKVQNIQLSRFPAYFLFLDPNADPPTGNTPQLADLDANPDG